MRRGWVLGTLAAFIVTTGGALAALQPAAGQAAQKPAAQKPASAKAGKTAQAKETAEREEDEGAKTYKIKVRLPAPVAAAFRKAYPDAAIRGTAKEVENGRTVYEVESLDKGRARDLLYTADGQVLEVEEQVEASDLPAAVTAALKRMYPAATIIGAEKQTVGGKVQYELQVKGAAKRTVSFTPDGQPVPPESK